MSSIGEPSEPNDLDNDSWIRVTKVDGSKMLKLVTTLRLSIPYDTLYGIVTTIILNKRDDLAIWDEFCEYLTNTIFYNSEGIVVRITVEVSEIDPADIILMDVSSDEVMIDSTTELPVKQFEFQTRDINNDTRDQCIVLIYPPAFPRYPTPPDGDLEF